MTDEITSEDTSVTETETTINNEPSQDPIEQEIAREGKTNEGRSEAEKAAFSLKKTAERLRELGGNPEEILGVKKEVQETTDDEIPEWYKKKEAQVQAKTALELADEISDPRERELVKIKLNTIITSGSPDERIRVARGYVNSVKNGQIAQEVARTQQAKTFVSGAGAPSKTVNAEPELSKDEQMFSKILTPAEIIATRPTE